MKTRRIPQQFVAIPVAQLDIDTFNVPEGTEITITVPVPQDMDAFDIVMDAILTARGVEHCGCPACFLEDCRPLFEVMFAQLTGGTHA